ncbi:MAG TPA: LysR family transcriptional regulator [Polyangiaceae bacterium]|nr:LysR family transcriptional regulator [Polyangiaceae bacterium]
MRYTLRQLEVFLAVARGDSVSRAAHELAMSQSAVSGALIELERQFDVQLFDRVGKRLQLNALGHSLRPRAEALAEHAREIEHALDKRSDIGPLRIGATLTIGNYVTIPIMAKFLSLYPGAQITLEIANTAEIARKVTNFEIDVGLVEGELHAAELETSPWREDELAVFCSPQHPLAGKPRLDEADLLGAAWIVRETGSGTRQAFDRSMVGLLPKLRIVLELQHTEAILSAVEAGLGAGCVSRLALRDAFRGGRLHHCPVPGRDFRRQFYFVLHRQKYRSTGIQRWLELCRTESPA